MLSLAFRRMLFPMLAIALTAIKLNRLHLRLALFGVVLFALAYPAETKEITATIASRFVRRPKSKVRKIAA
jgi:hypothetical protein